MTCRSHIRRPGSCCDSGELLQLTAGEAVARMSRGEITVERYARVLLARCEAFATLNASYPRAFRACWRQHVHATVPALRRKARSAVRPARSGQDSVNTRDYPRRRDTRPAQLQPAARCAIVGSLRASGAIDAGKTNLHELSYGWTSNNLAFGPCAKSLRSKANSGGSMAARQPRWPRTWRRWA